MKFFLGFIAGFLASAYIDATVDTAVADLNKETPTTHWKFDS